MTDPDEPPIDWDGIDPGTDRDLAPFEEGDGDLGKYDELPEF